MPRRVRTRLFSPALLIRNNALRQGVLGPSRAWRAVAVLVFGRQFLKRTFGRRPEIVSVERLLPGQTVSVTAIRPVTRRQQRAARRSTL